MPFAELDDLVEPQPMTIAVIMVNTDWAKQNQELVRNYFVAWLRGVRDYCQAFHGGANRQEIIDIAGQQRHRAPAGAAEQVSVAGAQPERQDQRREPARHPGLVREEQVSPTRSFRPSG